MKITLVSHGQTENNFLRILEGRGNSLLNDSGRRQCDRLRLKLINNKYDYCYTSFAVRCVETSFILVGDRTEIIKDKRLAEREIGEYEGVNMQEYNAYKYWNYDLNISDRGVEGVKDLFSRCQSLLDYLKEKCTDENIIIVTHFAPYRALRFLLKNKKLKGYMLDGFIDNCMCEEFII